jgi:hypothetical protein
MTQRLGSASSQADTNKIRTIKAIRAMIPISMVLTSFILHVILFILHPVLPYGTVGNAMGDGYSTIPVHVSFFLKTGANRRPLSLSSFLITNIFIPLCHTR